MLPMIPVKIDHPKVAKICVSVESALLGVLFNLFSVGLLFFSARFSVDSRFASHSCLNPSASISLAFIAVLDFF